MIIYVIGKEISSTFPVKLYHKSGGNGYLHVGVLDAGLKTHAYLNLLQSVPKTILCHMIIVLAVVGPYEWISLGKQGDTIELHESTTHISMIMRCAAIGSEIINNFRESN